MVHDLPVGGTEEPATLKAPGLIGEPSRRYFTKRIEGIQHAVHTHDVPYHGTLRWTAEGNGPDQALSRSFSAKRHR